MSPESRHTRPIRRARPESAMYMHAAQEVKHAVSSTHSRGGYARDASGPPQLAATRREHSRSRHAKALQRVRLEGRLAAPSRTESAALTRARLIGAVVLAAVAHPGHDARKGGVRFKVKQAMDGKGGGENGRTSSSRTCS